MNEHLIFNSKNRYYPNPQYAQEIGLITREESEDTKNYFEREHMGNYKPASTEESVKTLKKICPKLENLIQKCRIKIDPKMRKKEIKFPQLDMESAKLEIEKIEKEEFHPFFI